MTGRELLRYDLRLLRWNLKAVIQLGAMVQELVAGSC